MSNQNQEEKIALQTILEGDRGPSPECVCFYKDEELQKRQERRNYINCFETIILNYKDEYKEDH